MLLQWRKLHEKTRKVTGKMAANKVVREGMKQVKPILSVDNTEAKRRVLNLYKAWYRQLPFIVKEFDMPVTVNECRRKLRQRFISTGHVTDVRAIDIMVIKGQMELVETLKNFKQKSHVMALLNDNPEEPKPKDFLSKFYEGHE